MQIGAVLGEAWSLYKRFLKEFFLTAFVVFLVLDLLSALANSASGDSAASAAFWALIAFTVAVFLFEAHLFEAHAGAPQRASEHCGFWTTIDAGLSCR